MTTSLTHGGFAKNLEENKGRKKKKKGREERGDKKGIKECDATKKEGGGGKAG